MYGWVRADPRTLSLAPTAAKPDSYYTVYFVKW